ncbi:DUF1064 domain-containing protein [Lactobacillus taiwanensis]|uniref:DUF1064 domain-containing protein n=1 Tax=Lactobacillus taiwanensis TaxID=508451 RepID=UPI00321FAF6A
MGKFGNKPGTHFGKKVIIDGYKFDSQKEAKFYQTYLKDTDLNYTVHETFTIIPKQDLTQNVRLRSGVYTPDFVIRDSKGELEHVIDLKNSFTQYGVDAAAQLRFKLFFQRFGKPVEVVVPRAHSFLMKVMGTTKKFDPVELKDFNYDVFKIINENL